MNKIDPQKRYECISCNTASPEGIENGIDDKLCLHCGDYLIDTYKYKI